MTQTFAMTVLAAGEVRDADGRLISTSEAAPTSVAIEVAGVTYLPNADGQIELPIEAFASLTDDQLRAAGLDEQTITEIRSTP